MKKLLFILAITTIGCSTATKENINQLSWPVGKWVNDWEDSTTVAIETWAMTENGIKGYGLTRTTDKDTLFIESILIHAEQDQILYSVNLESNKESVSFVLTDSDDNYWRFENPAHDFPQIIEYRLSSDTLFATVSNKERSLDFIFRRARK